MNSLPMTNNNGMVSGTTLGGFVHLLLILAIAVVLIRVIQGRRPI